MDRRELLKMIAVVTGGAVIGGELFLTGCKNEPKIGGPTFTAEDTAFLDEVADTIIPTTKSPGAKAAKVGQFMTVMVNDCYDADDQKLFHEGIKSLDESSNQKFSKGFMAITPEQRKELLIELDKKSKDEQKTVDEKYNGLTMDQRRDLALQQNKDGKDPKAEDKRKNPTYYFILMKQLTLLGYFTSKEGATQALRYVAVPTKFEGTVDYKKGDKAWATS
ncbi:MAG: gluconate 2-dehydrogenase subunit 3 family protein [Bacteroidetes bacterium]|nr:gluconate 2-dehydrogenase subunit 3 family protein [Bacteroidota bacterium]